MAVRHFALACAAMSVASLAATQLGAQLKSMHLTPPNPEVTACVSAARARRAGEAIRRAGDLEAAMRARLARAPRDVAALTALAQTLVQCRLPFAELPDRALLTQESIELLQRALEVDPAAWTPRFTLASIYANLPPVFNRSREAAQELDTLLALQGDRADVTVLARPYDLRGMLYARAGQTDSALAVWRRGAALFPGDSALQRRARGADPRATPAGATPPGAPPAGGASQSPPPSSEAPPSGGVAAAGGGAAPAEVSQAPTSTPAPATSAPRTAASAASQSATRTATLSAVRVSSSYLAVPVAGPPGQVTLSRAQVMTTPGAMADVLQAIQLQPGVTRATEGSDLYTRGGDPTETPIIVDGGRTLAASRFEALNGGLFGVLDPQVMRAVRFSSGGFSARFGNALSGVLDLETDGRPRRGAVRAGLNTVQGGTTLRRPVGARAGTWGTVRASNAGPMLQMHGRAGEFSGAPWSIESMGGLVLEPRPGTELRAVALFERDEARRIVDAGGHVAPYDAGGDTRLLVLNGRTLMPRAPVFLRANLAIAERGTRADFGVLSRDRRERSALARADVEWMSGVTTLRGGVEGGVFGRREQGRLPTTPLIVPGAPSGVIDADTATRQFGGYVEAERPLGTRFSVLGGVRADLLPGESVTTLDPRVALSWRGGAWTARLASGIYHQGQWRPAPTVPNPGAPGSIPTQARHLTAGLERDGALRWRVEAFHKQYGRYVPLGAGPRVIGGEAQGGDIVVQRAAGGRVWGWVGYSYLHARLDLADGRQVRSPVDVTHGVTAVTTARVGSQWTVGTTARYATGLPYTPVVAATPTPQGFSVPVYGAPLGARLPTYARLDGRVTRILPVARGNLAMYAEVLNLLDRANVQSYTYDPDYAVRRPVTGFFGARTFIVGMELQPR